jgi:acetoacetyl-CoA synthetase
MESSCDATNMGSTEPSVMWHPHPTRPLRLQTFMEHVRHTYHVPVLTFHDLYAWSVSDPANFWTAVWEVCGVIGHRGARSFISSTGNDHMLHARFFPDAQLNYAENLLRRRDDHPALIAYTEDAPPRTWSYAQLWHEVERLASALADLGLQPGDRVAGLMINSLEAIATALATASLGGVWCSCSPDFGVTGVLDRFAQIEPKVLFAIEGYSYNGKSYDNRDKIRDIARKLPTACRVITLPALTPQPETQVPPTDTPRDLVFQPLAFADPLFILFTSGTTGAPKCIMHGVGGTLLQHMKEHQLHCDFQPDDRVFYFSTCSWMMWNWLTSALASEATLVLYDGAPTYPRADRLFDIAEDNQLHFMGVSARYLDLLRKDNFAPGRTHRLDALRMLGSTGSPLLPEDFDYVYQHIKSDVCLASLSGGTDIISCFALGCPILPVHRGELQTPGLGMNIAVFDENGHSVMNTKGELVCTAPFPSMPVGFWNDPQQQKYRAAYFERFPNVWCHGDWVMMNEATGGLVIYGRSDTVLKPGGVRIGTAEIYHALDEAEDILEALAVGQDWDNDMRVILFVKMRENTMLTAERIQELKSMIRSKASPRHVPSKIISVADIPRTRNGKIVESAVRDMIHHRPVKNRESLANPEALALFENLPELQS